MDVKKTNKTIGGNNCRKYVSKKKRSIKKKGLEEIKWLKSF